MSEHTTIDRDGIRAVVDARTAIVVEALAASYYEDAHIPARGTSRTTVTRPRSPRYSPTETRPLSCTARTSRARTRRS